MKPTHFYSARKLGIKGRRAIESCKLKVCKITIESGSDRVVDLSSPSICDDIQQMRRILDSLDQIQSLRP